MNHIKGFRKLNITHSHRRALYRNLVEALFKNERIKTTLIKAKELRRVAEKIITKAKINNIHNIRVVNRLIKDKDILMKLFNDIAPRFTERNGGYTRIIKLFKRKGDGALLAYIELVDEGQSGKKKKKKVKSETKKAPEAKNDEKSDKTEIKEKKEIKADKKEVKTGKKVDVVETHETNEDTPKKSAKKSETKSEVTQIKEKEIKKDKSKDKPKAEKTKKEKDDGKSKPKKGKK